MWWLVFFSAIGAIIATFTRFGFNVVAILITLPIIYTAFNTLYSNVRKVRILLRKTINVLSLSTFDMQFRAVFNIEEHKSKVKNINNDYLLIQDVIYDVLKNEGFSGKKNELIEPSLDRVSGVKFYIHPYKIYMSLDQSDNFGEQTLTLTATGRLKFRNGEAILNDFLINLYEGIENLGMPQNKYILKLSKNSKTDNFMTKHFIKELEPKEVKDFNILMNQSNMNITANHQEITIVTKQKINLIKGIKYSLELIN
ncbi:hypothetical protein BpOF4_06420 [Alkalihalophilus pseudofirmus OF4]|uniref:Uncharacterized protein n=1 Tax=Alkalihalophilus pseudofirmus (strain ATCC BAA-2126 / JCM 17055 / OF4) TaxID=398511 RepID=D3G069_ALKPO|nr:hypothetical protein [Alkalihalophilus pseudofirmus]ADC49344.1 hypothetical protein BpOF4_06420 [Alkalihalophilus pseudofirmus OF4]